MTGILHASVRALVEEALRAGDLDLESYGAPSPTDGIRGHQLVQASRPEGYRKEVKVSRTFVDEGLVLELHGRIDGVHEGPTEPRVEEIKTTRRELEPLRSEEQPRHWAQLRVYGFLYAEARGLASIEMQLTYYRLDTGETAAVLRSESLEELRAFTESLVARFLAGKRSALAWKQERDRRIAACSFPFPDFRTGQQELTGAVERAIRQGSDILAQAPTGVGKTLAVLFPAVKAIGEGLCARIVYATARTTGRAQAEKALAELRRCGAGIRAVTLTAREAICFNPGKPCLAAHCDYARGFYDRIDAALEDGLAEEEWTRSAVEALARKHQVCPFELSLELASRVDVMVCDYNHVFHPRCSPGSLFAENAGESALLVDEAHHLVERARETFSAEISRRGFVELRRAVDRNEHAALHRAAGKVSSWLLQERSRFAGRAGVTEDRPTAEALRAVADFAREAESFLASHPGADALRELVRELHLATRWFSGLAERWDESYALCVEPFGTDVRVKLFCRDPAARLEDAFSRFRSSILFSATLSPRPYFRRTLGIGTDSSAAVLPSPFPSENFLVLLTSGLDTTYRRRAATSEKLTSLLVELVRSKPGHYLFYFPSYQYLASILPRFTARCPGAEVVVQRPRMPESERDSFLERFEPNGGTLVGFAVLGGVFGEAIDLPGEKLHGAAIVGMGLPAPSPERECVREHFDREEDSGFAYAYLYPGWNRVLQAAGRVIRSEKDRGVVLLIDERFHEERCRALLPSHWRTTTVRNPPELAKTLEAFWRA